MKKRNKRKLILIVMCILIVGVLVSALQNKRTGKTIFSIKQNVAQSGTQEDPWNISTNDGTSNVTAVISEDGTLTISGTGSMKEWDNADSVEWSTYREEIISIKIEGQVTNIGKYAFSQCVNLLDIVISDNITQIGDEAFKGCTNLQIVTIPNSVTSIGSNAFEGCNKNLTIYGYQYNDEKQETCPYTYAKENNIDFIILTVNKLMWGVETEDYIDYIYYDNDTQLVHCVEIKAGEAKKIRLIGYCNNGELKDYTDECAIYDVEKENIVKLENGEVIGQNLGTTYLWFGFIPNTDMSIPPMLKINVVEEETAIAAVGPMYTVALLDGLWVNQTSDDDRLVDIDMELGEIRNLIYFDYYCFGEDNAWSCFRNVLSETMLGTNNDSILLRNGYIKAQKAGSTLINYKRCFTCMGMFM